MRPIALPAAMRTSGPLVGAALDRVSYAFEFMGCLRSMLSHGRNVPSRPFTTEQDGHSTTSPLLKSGDDGARACVGS